MSTQVSAARVTRYSQGRNALVSKLVLVGLWIGVVISQIQQEIQEVNPDQAWTIDKKSENATQLEGSIAFEQLNLEESASENSEVFSWETSETSMGLSRSMTSSSWQIFWDLGMSLRHRREKLGNSSITECEVALLRVVEHIKNASYSVEVQNILYNTGKVFNDVGYYTSCMNTSNLTYYLIRPINENLTTKFNFGVCVPTNCTLEAVNTLIAQDVINKKWLKHIANGTSSQPEDYTSAATVVPTDQQFSSSAIVFMVAVSVLMGTSLISPAIEFVKWAKTLKTSDFLESEDEESSSQTPESGEQAAQPDPEANQQADSKPTGAAPTLAVGASEYKEPEGILERFVACWTAWGSLQYLGRGRRDDINSINAVKFVCAFLIVYSTEYFRRQSVGTNQDDKLSLDRTYRSWGYNLAYMAPFAFDMLFFLSALTNTMALTISLKQRLLQSSAEGLTIKSALEFYIFSTGSRFMRLAPTLFIVAYSYHAVVPGLVTGPFEYLFATTYAQECSNSPGWAYSFVANLFKDTNYCTGSFSWYVFSMFQLYLILPVYVLVCQLNSYAGMLLATTLATSSVCGALAVFGIEDLGLIGPYSTTQQYQQYQDHYQSKPWAVGYCWFFGAILGLQMANRRLSELRITSSSTNRQNKLQNTKPSTEANKQTIASLASVTKGSALTLTPNNQESLLGNSNKQDRRAEEPPADLLPARPVAQEVSPSAALGSDVESRDSTEQQSVGSVVLSVGVLIIALAIPVAVFVGFVEFSRTKNEWGAVVQVGFDVISRLAIMLSTSVLIWHFGFTHEASPLHKNKTKADSHFTLLGAVSRFGLAYYLWAMLYIDWGMASQMVNQYYDSLLVFCYTMADSVVLTFLAIPLTLTLEIPLKRLFRFY